MSKMKKTCSNTMVITRFYAEGHTNGRANEWMDGLRESKSRSDKYKPPHDKTNKMTVRPAKMWKSRLCGCPGWSRSSLGAQSFCWFYREAAHIRILSMSILTAVKDVLDEDVRDVLTPHSSGFQECETTLHNWNYKYIYFTYFTPRQHVILAKLKTINT